MTKHLIWEILSASQSQVPTVELRWMGHPVSSLSLPGGDPLTYLRADDLR